MFARRIEMFKYLVFLTHVRPEGPWWSMGGWLVWNITFIQAVRMFVQKNKPSSSSWKSKYPAPSTIAQSSFQSSRLEPVNPYIRSAYICEHFASWQKKISYSTYPEESRPTKARFPVVTIGFVRFRFFQVSTTPPAVPYSQPFRES